MRRNVKRILSFCLAAVIAISTVGYAPPSFVLNVMTTKSSMEEAMRALASPSEAEKNVAEVATSSEAENPGDKAAPSEAVKKFVQVEPEEVPEHYTQVKTSGKKFWKFEDRYSKVQYRNYGYIQGEAEFPSWYEADQTGNVEVQSIINQDEEFYDLAPYIWTSVEPNEENWNELSEQQYCDIQSKDLLQFENWDETKYGIWHVIVTEKQIEHMGDDVEFDDSEYNDKESYELSEKESYQQKSYDLYFLYGFAQNVRTQDDPKWLESDSNGQVMMRWCSSYQNIMAKMVLNVEAESLIPIRFRSYNLNQANSLEEFYDEKVIYACKWPSNNNDSDAMKLWNSDANLEKVLFPVLENDGDIFLGWTRDSEQSQPSHLTINSDKEYLGQVPQIFRSSYPITQYFGNGSASSPISQYNTTPGFPLIPGGTEAEARSFMGPNSNSSTDRIYKGVWIPGDKPSLILINGLKDYYGGFGFRRYEKEFFQYSTTIAENVEMVESISVAQNFGDKFHDLKFRKSGSSDLGLPNALTYFYDGYGVSNSNTRYYDSRRLVGYFSKPDGMGQKLDANYEFNKVSDKYYAYFVPKTQNFQVEFQDESGNTIRKDQVVPGRAISNPPVAPDKSGYAFNGWVDASGGNSTLTQVLRDTVFKPSYQKEKEERTLTLDTNGGSFANHGGSDSLSLQVEVGSGINSIIYGQSENIPSMQDYEFDGWYEQPEGQGVAGRLDDVTENFMPDHDVIYYAHWLKTHKHIVYKDWNGDILKTQEVAIGEAATPPTDSTRTGYTFTGWDKSSSDIQEDTVITAQYTINSHRLVLDGNGGKIDGNLSTDKILTYGQSFDQVLTDGAAEANRKYYSFDGWYTAPTGGSKYSGIGNTMPDSDVTAYAHWMRRSSEVTYQDWDGTKLKTQEVAIGGNATPPANPTRPGYTFTGWDHSYTDIQDHTILTAQYSINGYLLTLNGNGGTLEGNARKDQVLSFNQSFDQVLKDGRDLVSRPGYSFAGWYNSSSGGSSYSYSGNLMPAANVTVFAHWTPNTYKVTFDPDHIRWTGEATTEEYTFDTRLGTLPIPEIYGWRFTGWWTGKKGTGTEVTNDSMVEPKDVVYYGKWQPETYQIRFISEVEQPEGESVQTFTVDLRYDQEFGNLPVPEEKGYTFIGWYDEDNKKVDSQTIFNPDSDAEGKTYHAGWKGKTYQIRFVYNDSDGRPVVKIIDGTYGLQIGTLPSPEKPGYTFAGWFMDNGEEVTAGSWVEPGDTEYKAKWIPNKYTIHFKSNMDSISDPENKTVTYALPIGDLPLLHATGYVFLGWYTESSEGSQIRETALTALGDQTYYGHWSIGLIDNGNGTYRKPGSDGKCDTADDEVWWYGPDETIGTSDDKKIDSRDVDPESTNSESIKPESEKRVEEEIVNAPVIPVIDSTVKPAVPDTGGTFTVNPNNPLEVTYIKPDGTAAKNEWVGDGKDWYHVDESGNLNYDWFLDGKRTWYKLNKEPGDRFGAALIGWNYEPMDDKRYFFDPSTTKMLTGWQFIDSKWYYFTKQNESQTYFGSNPEGWKYDPTKPGKPYGSMYQNEFTPDGYQVDENGVWKNKLEEQ